MSLKIYYLDDEEELLEAFSELFSTEDVVVSTFSDASLALSVINEDPPDILFLDYRLNKITGDEIAHQLPTSIPKALLTGDIKTARTANFNKVFSKPYMINEIQSFIDTFKVNAKTCLL